VGTPGGRTDHRRPHPGGRPRPVFYGNDKRGGELAAIQAFGDRVVLARAGLILGPHEDLGRLPYWLLRAERGGPMLAPGPPDHPWQYVDVRDLAAWMLDAAGDGVTGPTNLVARPATPPPARCSRPPSR
jgi:2'-hydroxyisoflavone reductase